MTTKECFDAMGADYEGVLERFSSEALVKKFALKFLDDNSYSNLEDALADGNVENAFRIFSTFSASLPSFFTRTLRVITFSFVKTE